MTQELYYNISVNVTGVSYDLSGDISTLTISEESGKPDQLVIEMSDLYKTFSHALQLGMDLEVDMGTVDDHSLIFKGKIYKVEAELPEDGVGSLRIVAHDGSMAMGLRKYNRRWRDKKLSEIVEEIGKKYFGLLGVEVEVEGDPTFTGNGVRQVEETDLAFILRLGRAYACELYVELNELGGEVLHFKSEKAIMNGEPAMSVYHGRCGVENRLLSFSANSDISNIQLPRQLIGMDYETGEATEMVSGDVEEVGDVEDQFRDENLAAMSQHAPLQAANLTGLLTAASSAQGLVREALGESRREAVPTLTTAEILQERSRNQFSTQIHGMQGSGSLAGNQHLHAQISIDIADVGGQFSGLWYLSQVRHTLNQEGFNTEFECQR